MKMLWYSVFSFLLFCLAPLVRKDFSMRTTSVTVMVIFRKCHSESYLTILKVTTMSKARYQLLRATLKAAFWKTSDSLTFYGHGSTYVLILSYAIIMKRISTKVPGQLRKSQLARRRTFHQYRSSSTVPLRFF